MLLSDIYARVASELNIPVSKVVEYDRRQWEFIKDSLNNPVADVIEVPYMGSFSITKVKMGRTLRQAIILLKKSKRSLELHPENTKLRIKHESYKELFRKLWKLKQECKL